MKNKVTMQELLPFIEEAFVNNKTFTIPITGISMRPLLICGRDTVTLKKCTDKLKKGDLPLYRRENGAFVLHRVVGFDKNGNYIMCGDNQFLKEYNIEHSQIIGVVSEITRNGNTFSVDSKKYDLYVKLGLLLLNVRYPHRRLRYFISQFQKKAGGNMNNQTIELTDQKTASCLETGRRLVKIIDGIINNKKADIPEDTDFERVLKLTYSHRISGMVAYCVEKYDLPEEIKKKFNIELFKTAARHTAQEHEVKELSKDFSKNKIEHCFLKGLKIASLYDVPEMRYMLDIDVFVNPAKFDDAIKVMENRGYEISILDVKDCAFSKKPFLNVDLHRELKYDYDLGYDFYENVYERLVPIENSYEKTMTKEEFYVYLLSHTAHHFATAGTGIKNVIDHYYIMKNLVPQCNENILNEYLKESGLKAFNEKFSKLTKVWFMGEESDTVTEQMTDYIILSGAYGTDINYFVNSTLRVGMGENKKEYFFKRLFPDYKIMCCRYPILEKFKILLPVFWIVRIISSVTDASRIKSEAHGISSVAESDKIKQDQFLKNVGL